LKLSDHVDEDGVRFFEEACKVGLEGIIAKRADLPHRSGRTPEWVKVKCQKRQELVIVGYTAPKGGRTGLGALLLGVHEGKTLRYAGKVGTGFTEASLADLTRRLGAMKVDEPAVVGAPRMRDATWTKPELVAQVRFTEWTREGSLRHPAFEGLREDKRASRVVREREAPVEVAEGEERGAILGVAISHPERVLDPASGMTKLELARYYEGVSEKMLRYAAQRPLMLMRCPEGNVRKGACFVQKHSGRGLQGAKRVAKDAIEGEEVLYVTDRSGIVELAQFNVVELHGWGCRLPRWQRPDWIVLDLDPDEGLAFAKVVDAALEMRELLKRAKLASYVKTTGGKGLHVVVPLAAKQDWDTVRTFAEGIAEMLAASAPDRYVATMSKRARKGKIFVDWLRNAKGATAILPYSVRARAGSPVAMPVAWTDLARLDPRELTVRTVPPILAKLRKDPWADVLTIEQTLGR
jgi:bifunctional non-homologous end joining protein LigD